MEIFRLENLSFTYPTNALKALDSLSITIESGDFVVVCGQSGCGKTTLLKMLKREMSPHGEKSGHIYYNETELSEITEHTAACEIGYVVQNPENQVVTDKVWHELAFGLENMGLPTSVIRRRVGEMASFFGIQEWFRKATSELSGGQKQLLNLASVMVMQPKVLILDEPTSQLDPIAAADFIATLQKLNKELGLTIILVEHRLEEVFPIADKVLVMENAKIIAYDEPREISGILQSLNTSHPMLKGLPSAVKIFSSLGKTEGCPLTVKEGRNFLAQNYSNDIFEMEASPFSPNSEIAVELHNVWFRYERDLPDVIRGVSFCVHKQETYCILGGNGTGKTTTLNVLSGLNKAYRGKIIINGKKIKDYNNNELYHHNIALLPQNPQTVFLKNTVRDDFTEISKVMQYDSQQQKQEIEEVTEQLSIHDLLDKHPYDLSGGEQQKCALAKMLLLKPKILLLDEPTKGIDAFAKETLKGILQDLKSQGMTIIIVTHDVEFACECADRCALFFDGEIMSEDIPREFFAQNNFYTTAANRIARQLYPKAVTCEDVVSLCLKNEVHHV
ncbi:MAG: energy-coupling factor transporter ATP-binding protein [Oscillospiraceae bacterium]|jgi:energy-coupling factor transport system ATP-binding protein|nr:energy-coupling factor transporter ATP-binding protein [Oscillospiraceae bacterium]